MQYVIELPEDLKRMIIDEGRFEVAHTYRLAACVKAGVALPEHHGRLIDNSESEKSAAKIFCEHGFHKDITPNEFDDRLDRMPMSEIREIMWRLYLRANNEEE